MELEQIRIFCTVAEHKSFSEAARRLYVSHSTTCRTVAALESELGVRLLERTKNSVSLTPAGVLLQQEGARLLHEAEALCRRLAGLRGDAPAPDDPT